MMLVSGETQIVLYYVVLYLIAVLVPLVPSILIYLLFPDTKVSASGPLAGLTVRAGGAFAAYMITFLLALSIVSPFKGAIATFITPVYTVTAEISLSDENGKQVTDPTLLNSATVQYIPGVVVNSFGKLRLKIPIDKDWPYLHVELRGLGSADLEYPFDEFDPHRTCPMCIDLQKPITIKLNPTEYNEAGSASGSSQ